MPRESTVHVVGTGTIGGPLVGLLADHRSELGLDGVTFYKHTPRAADRPLLRALRQRGARMAVAPEKADDFRALGLEPDLTADEALEAARVVVDCTPQGLANKPTYETLDDGTRTFLAQGSEAGFGVPYALGVNDEALEPVPSFVHVVSCNTHNISVLLNALAFGPGGSSGNIAPHLLTGRFVCIRRAGDVSDTKFLPAPHVGTHGDDRYGSHHARDVADVYRTLGHDLDLFSSAMKVPTQYMHTIWFSLALDHDVTRDEALQHLRDHPRIGLTQRADSNLVFTTGRELGPYGRILAQTVVSEPTVTVRNGNEVVGFCFTPQDGNVLLTNLAVATRALHPEDWAKRMAVLDDAYLLDEY